MAVTRARGSISARPLIASIYEPARLAGSRWAPVVLDAVQRTAGVILMYDGAPADAVYHADCGGWTSAAEDMWSGPPRTYLPAQPDRGDAKDAHVAWQYAVGRDALQRALNSDSRSRSNGTLVAITVLSRDASGRARQVLLRADRAKQRRDRSRHRSAGSADECVRHPLDPEHVVRRGRERPRVSVFRKWLRSRRRPVPGWRARTRDGRRDAACGLDALLPRHQPHAVIAYTTRLTANLVLSSRWKRLLRQS